PPCPAATAPRVQPAAIPEHAPRAVLHPARYRTAKQPPHLPRPRRRGQVPVHARQAEERVPDRAPHGPGLETGLLEPARDPPHGRRRPQIQGSGCVGDQGSRYWGRATGGGADLCRDRACRSRIAESTEGFPDVPVTRKRSSSSYVKPSSASSV